MEPEQLVGVRDINTSIGIAAQKDFLASMGPNASLGDFAAALTTLLGASVEGLKNGLATLSPWRRPIVQSGDTTKADGSAGPDKVLEYNARQTGIAAATSAATTKAARGRCPA